MKLNRKYERGQALILIVGAIIGLVALVALAIDGGNVLSNRRSAQNAADTAALAGALAKVKNQDWSGAALARATSNNFTNDASNTVTVTNPPAAGCNGTNGPYAGNNEYIQVIIHSTVDTYFGSIVGRDQLHNCVEAIARAKPSTTGPIAFGNALVSLNPHDCRSFWAHGNSDTDVTGSGVFVNSDCASGAFQAFDLSGHASLTAPSICVVGGATYGTGDVTPPPDTGCGTQIPYPPPYLWPQPTCSAAGTNIGGVITPGSIPGSWISGNVTLLPGTYCISGDVTVNANNKITGNGVLLYLINGGIHINGGAELNLSAQTAGTYAGLLIYLPITNSSIVILNGNANTAFTGTILAPASEVQVNGTGSTYGYHSQIIGYTLDFIGNATANIHYSDADNYDIPIPPSIEIAK